MLWAACLGQHDWLRQSLGLGGLEHALCHMVFGLALGSMRLGHALGSMVI
jgi:hypothetical protein